MPPPPAEPFAARIFLGPALRTQPDRRLVKLVREGYESAFEEIVRRYRKPLDRFAAGFVGNRSEDITQDAFSKALLALRGSEKEIELRPWLYRIVRNTALNDLRDGAPPTAELGEAAAIGPSAAVEAERREEIAELMQRLQALPEPQRAAIVMRELEGLSHEEIAAGLGVSGGAARQAIHRARTALRDGLGLLVPLPLLRLLFDQGADAVAGGAAGGAAVAAGAAAGGGGATLGGIGAAGALKVGFATVLLAGSVGAGVAVQHDRAGERRGPEVAEAATFGGGASAPLDDSDGPGPSFSGGDGERRGGSEGRGADRGRGDDGHRDGDRGPGDGRSDDSGRGSGASFDADDGSGSGRGGHSGRGGRSGGEDSGSGGGHSGRGSGSGDSGSDRSGGDGGSRSGSGGGSKSVSDSSSGGSGKDGSGGGSEAKSGSESSGSGSGSGGSSGTSGGSGSSGGGSSGQDGGEAAAVITPPPPEPAPEVPSDSDSGSSGGGSGSSGGSSGSGSSGSGDDS